MRWFRWRYNWKCGICEEQYTEPVSMELIRMITPGKETKEEDNLEDSVNVLSSERDGARQIKRHDDTEDEPSPKRR